jgi:hypothetical protein
MIGVRQGYVSTLAAAPSSRRERQEKTDGLPLSYERARSTGVQAEPLHFHSALAQDLREAREQGQVDRSGETLTLL